MVGAETYHTVFDEMLFDRGVILADFALLVILGKFISTVWCLLLV